MHLGMTGRFTVSGKKPGKFHHEAGEDGKHDHVVFEMQGGASVVFNDARRFGFMDLWPLDELNSYPPFDGMGPEPISNRFSGAYLEEAFADKKAPVKAALLDQYVVAGLGNIYVCEALFRAGVSPKKLAGAIKRDKLEKLAVEIRKVIEEAIEAGGSTISDFDDHQRRTRLLPAPLPGLRFLPVAVVSRAGRCCRAGSRLRSGIGALFARYRGRGAYWRRK